MVRISSLRFSVILESSLEKSMSVLTFNLHLFQTSIIQVVFTKTGYAQI